MKFGKKLRFISTLAFVLWIAICAAGCGKEPFIIHHDAPKTSESAEEIKKIPDALRGAFPLTRK